MSEICFSMMEELHSCGCCASKIVTGCFVSQEQDKFLIFHCVRLSIQLYSSTHYFLDFFFGFSLLRDFFLGFATSSSSSEAPLSSSVEPS